MKNLFVWSKFYLSWDGGPGAYCEDCTNKNDFTVILYHYFDEFHHALWIIIYIALKIQ